MKETSLRLYEKESVM